MLTALFKKPIGLAITILSAASLNSEEYRRTSDL